MLHKTLSLRAIFRESFLFFLFLLLDALLYWWVLHTSSLPSLLHAAQPVPSSNLYIWQEDECYRRPHQPHT